jgi:hypothetical protein
MERLMRASRGQAVYESAIFLPLALLTLWGMIWAAQYSLSAERVQSSLRYSGLIANQVDPFQQFSMYVLYSAAANTASPLPSPTCNGTTTDALTNSNTYPGPATVPFFENSPAPAATGCANTNNDTTEASYQSIGGNTLTNPALIVSNIPYVTTSINVPSVLRSIPFIGPMPSWPATAKAQLNFMRPADMGTTLACFQPLQEAVGQSLAPTPQASDPGIASPTPMPNPLPTPTFIPLKSGC